MITNRRIVEYVNTEPFRPFRLRMASGRSFEVKHPEMILVGKTTARVYYPTDDDSKEKPFWHEVSLLLMEGIEPVNESVPETGSNGR